MTADLGYNSATYERVESDVIDFSNRCAGAICIEFREAFLGCQRSGLAQRFLKIRGKGKISDQSCLSFCSIPSLKSTQIARYDHRFRLGLEQKSCALSTFIFPLPLTSGSCRLCLRRGGWRCRCVSIRWRGRRLRQATVFQLGRAGNAP